MKEKSPLFRTQKNVHHLLHVRHARTIGERFKGLLGVSAREHTYGLVFHLSEPSVLAASIHMLGMQMPIDVVWLNENKKIVDLVKELRPWTLNYSPREPARYLVELPAGSLSKFGIKINEKMDW